MVSLAQNGSVLRKNLQILPEAATSVRDVVLRTTMSRLKRKLERMVTPLNGCPVQAQTLSSTRKTTRIRS